MTALPMRSEEAAVTFEGGMDLIRDSGFYLCGRLLSDQAVSALAMWTAMTVAWRLKKFERGL